jgi:hypothetical protein
VILVVVGLGTDFYSYRLAVLGWLGSSELQEQLGKENGCNFGVYKLEDIQKHANTYRRA